MAERVKGDCGANSMEHSFALTHLIPIGLWVMVIGCHLGSARVHLRRVEEREFGRVGVLRDVEAGPDGAGGVPRYALGSFRNRRPRGRATFPPRVDRASREKVPPGEDSRQSHFSYPLPKARRAGRRTSARLAVGKLVSLIDRAVRQ